jgi:hypothetical protein
MIVSNEFSDVRKGESMAQFDALIRNLPECTKDIKTEDCPGEDDRLLDGCGEINVWF